MPNGLVPPGSRAILLGSAASIKDLGIFAPQEEGAAEGALMLMRLDFADFPAGESLDRLNKALSDAGVLTWPGYPFIVYADTATPSSSGVKVPRSSTLTAEPKRTALYPGGTIA